MVRGTELTLFEPATLLHCRILGEARKPFADDRTAARKGRAAMKEPRKGEFSLLGRAQSSKEAAVCNWRAANQPQSRKKFAPA